MKLSQRKSMIKLIRWANSQKGGSSSSAPPVDYWDLNPDADMAVIENYPGTTGAILLIAEDGEFSEFYVDADNVSDNFPNIGKFVSRDVSNMIIGYALVSGATVTYRSSQ